jgi:hypothetical protein
MPGRKFPMKKLIPVFAAAVLLLTTTGCVWVGSDTRAMRDAALDEIEGKVEKQFELSVGRLVFFAAGITAHYVDIPEEAREALNAIKSGEVSVHHIEGGKKASKSNVLASVDKEMQARGWMRMVGVCEAHELVAVYVPEKGGSSTHAAVLVLTDHELVCVSSKCDLQPLLKLGMEKAQLAMK